MANSIDDLALQASIFAYLPDADMETVGETVRYWSSKENEEELIAATGGSIMGWDLSGPAELASFKEAIHRIAEGELGCYVIPEHDGYFDDPSGLYAYRLNPPDGATPPIIAVRGTDSSYSEWAMDGHLVTGDSSCESGMTPEHDALIEWVNSQPGLDEGYYPAGHSLAGALVQWLAYEDPSVIMGYEFDGPGLPDWYLAEHEYRGNLKGYADHEDPANAFGDKNHDVVYTDGSHEDWPCANGTPEVGWAHSPALLMDPRTGGITQERADRGSVPGLLGAISDGFEYWNAPIPRLPGDIPGETVGILLGMVFGKKDVPRSVEALKTIMVIVICRHPVFFICLGLALLSFIALGSVLANWDELKSLILTAATDLLDAARDELIKTSAAVLGVLSTAWNRIIASRDALLAAIGGALGTLKSGWDSLRSSAWAAAKDIAVNLQELDEVVSLLGSAQRDLSRADRALSELVMFVRVEQVPEVVWADWGTGPSLRLALFTAYVQGVVTSFGSTEARLTSLAQRIAAQVR